MASQFAMFFSQKTPDYSAPSRPGLPDPVSLRGAEEDSLLVVATNA